MKNFRLILLIVCACLLLSSCGVSLRDSESLTSEGDASDVTTASDTADTEKITDTQSSPDNEITDTQSDTPAEPDGATDTEGEAASTADGEQTGTVDSEQSSSDENTVAPDTSATVESTPAQVVVPTAQYAPKTLMYHLILEEVYGPYEKLFVRPSEFETHLTVLDELGYEYLFAEEWRMTDKPSVIITLDDGYEDNYTEMFPILKAHGAKATVFIVTDLIGTDGYMTREQIAEMSRSGLVSFQCHTAHHRDLSYQSADALHADFKESVGIIEGITGKPVKALAYPAGSYNDTVLAVAAEYFSFAYTTKAPAYTPSYTPYTIPRYYIARGYGADVFKGFVGY